MNYTNSILNGTSKDLSNFNLFPNIPQECVNQATRSLEYNTECILRHICPQLQSWYITTGIIIIVAYIGLSWVLWWFFKYGFKYIKYDPTNPIWKYIGDLTILDNRIYWDTWIRNKLSKVMLGYIAVVIYLNWSY